MKSTTVVQHDWFDIQEEICKEMKIDPKYFRNYHDLIGGEYKDLWHEWLHYFNDVIHNDSTIDMELEQNEEDIKNRIKWVIKEKKEWLIPFITAVYKVWKDNNITHIRFCW